MADTSRSQVTITLGRSGQVVKRAGAVLDSDLSVPIPAVGSKRSVRDRLGGGVELDSKRLRGDNGRWNLKASNGFDDLHLSKDDLRFKIMKRAQSHSQQNMVDLRDMLSRRSSSTNPVTSYSTHESRHGRERVPEPRDNSRQMREPRYERQSMVNPGDDRPRRPLPSDDRTRRFLPSDDRPRGPVSSDDRPRRPVSRDDPRGSVSSDDRPRGPVSSGDRPRGPVSRDDGSRGLMSRDDRQRMAEPMDGRHGMPEPGEVRNRVPKPQEVRPRIAERPTGGMTGQYTSLRTSEGPPRMGFSGNSYSPWTLDDIRSKSPDRSLNTRGSSPPKTRAYEDSRSLAYGNRDFSEISRPRPPSSFLTKPPLSGVPMPRVAPTKPPGADVQRSQYPAEPLTVEGFLRSLGLEKYLISFKVEEVDMPALSQMGDQDLKELGIPMGPRKKIVRALLARTGRQAR